MEYLSYLLYIVLGAVLFIIRNDLRTILVDTLMVKGKWSQKRIMTFSSFFVALVYAFIPAFIPAFEVRDFVFIGFIGAGGWSLLRTQKQNENTMNNNDFNNNENQL